MFRAGLYRAWAAPWAGAREDRVADLRLTEAELLLQLVDVRERLAALSRPGGEAARREDLGPERVGNIITRLLRSYRRAT